jgi:hypothetical protein
MYLSSEEKLLEKIRKKVKELSFWNLLDASILKASLFPFFIY